MQALFHITVSYANAIEALSSVGLFAGHFGLLVNTISAHVSKDGKLEVGVRTASVDGAEQLSLEFGEDQFTLLFRELVNGKLVGKSKYQKKQFTSIKKKLSKSGAVFRWVDGFESNPSEMIIPAVEQPPVLPGGVSVGEITEAELEIVGLKPRLGIFDSKFENASCSRTKIHDDALKLMSGRGDRLKRRVHGMFVASGKTYIFEPDSESSSELVKEFIKRIIID